MSEDQDAQKEARRHIDTYRAEMRKVAVDWHKEQSMQSESWVLETVKHLAFVNAAGLTGAAALAATSKPLPTIGPIPAEVSFSLGLLFALADMYMNHRGHDKRRDELLTRIRTYDASVRGWVTPQTVVDATDQLFKDVLSGQPYFRLAEVFGWLSVGFFVLGAMPFVLKALS